MSTSIHYPTASLKPHKEEQLLKGHLWVFSGALQQVPKWVAPGGLLDLKDARGQFIARGYYNNRTDIVIRILTRKSDELIDVDFFRKRIRHAMEARISLNTEQTNAYRLINAEGDGLPGLIVDRYADIMVVQIHTLGMEQLRPVVVEALVAETGTKGVLIRNDSQSRRREGLHLEQPTVAFGEVPPRVEIIENGIRFLVDPWEGQKTGFFLDQRDNRETLRRYVQGKRILNCFSYTGGFSVYAAKTSKVNRVTSVDISESAMEMARENFVLNGLDLDLHEFIVEDVFEYLEQARRDKEKFDVVVLDPPAFAKNKGSQEQALLAYERLNMLGMQLLRPGGVLLTCSCSGVVSMKDFMETVTKAADKLKLSLQVYDKYTHALDHPINKAMPETAYLKAVFYRVGA